jgi:hypothetical protein
MAGKARPRPWVSLDVAFLTQDTIMELRHGFGPAGPLAFLALILEARQQAGAGGEAGLVALRYTALAGLVGCTADEAKGIVHLAAEIGLVALHGDDGRRFTARMLKRESWEPKDPLAAERQRRRRALAEDDPCPF